LNGPAAAVAEAAESLTGAAFVAAAEDLAPRIQAAADSIEDERGLPADLVDALYDAGLFTLLLPRALGGHQVDLLTFVRCVEAIARADASAGWCIGQANGLAAYMAHLDPRAAADVFGGRRTILANGPGEGNQPGRAVEDRGGYRVTGRWMFASGIRHATWLLAICALTSPDGTPRTDPDGSPSLRLLLLPKSAATLHDVWQVSGLRGTGSWSFSVTDLHVPAARAVWIAPHARVATGTLYRFTNNGVFGPAFGSVALGIAHTCLQDLIDFAGGKVPRGMERSIRENAVVQSTVAQAQARLLAARGFLRDTLAEVWAAVAETGELHVEQQVRVRLAATHATHEAAAVVDAAYTLAGSHAIFRDRPFERRFRDVHAVTQQLQGRRAHYEHVGRYLLGLPPEPVFL
jgi:alkylation response protein AidB-like acyl-CoA dehydrogenase